FFLTAPPTPEIHTLPLHDALPISMSARSTLARAASPAMRPAGNTAHVAYAKAHARSHVRARIPAPVRMRAAPKSVSAIPTSRARSEEHTSELQSLTNLVCRLLLEK